jgi:hypothetical protein
MLLALAQWAFEGTLFSAIFSPLGFYATKTHTGSSMVGPHPCRRPSAAPAELARAASAAGGTQAART